MLMISVLESLTDLMKQKSSRQWVWISDFHGFGLRDCSLTMLVVVAQLLDHYPDRLGLATLIGNPRVMLYQSHNNRLTL